MRKQYFFRSSPRGLLAWDVDRLVHLSRNLPVRALPLGEISALDEPVFGEEEPPTAGPPRARRSASVPPRGLPAPRAS